MVGLLLFYYCERSELLAMKQMLVCLFVGHAVKMDMPKYGVYMGSEQRSPVRGAHKIILHGPEHASFIPQD